VVLLKIQDCSRKWSRKAETVDFDTYSIPVDLSRVKEPRYLLDTSRSIEPQVIWI